jgi:hypothetical protein
MSDMRLKFLSFLHHHLAAKRAETVKRAKAFPERPDIVEM